jgi:alkanesulfonate monooxygenase SsuD/methylene tetrahydromethanopterin reductase-like flavin-dependent oxidoreductase (luciferase family)
MANPRAGIQLHLQTYNNLTVPQLVNLAAQAASGGIDQVWVTDNLENRDIFVVLAAIASKVPVRLGAGVMVQYFHSPIDAATSAASVAEMMDGRELSIAIARGNQRTPDKTGSPKPVTMLRETAQAMNALLSGESVEIDRFPKVGSYFNLPSAASYRLDMTPPSNVRLYCGGNAPLSMAVGGAHMDGLLFGARFLSTAKAGALWPLMDVFNTAATDAGKGELPKVAEVKLSVHQDHEFARSYVRARAGSRLAGLTQLGFTPEQVAQLGIERDELRKLEGWVEAHGRGPEVAELTTDAMLDAMFVAGDPAYCRERLAEVSALASEYGFEQLMFSELGADPAEGLRLLSEEILPSL